MYPIGYSVNDSALFDPDTLFAMKEAGIECIEITRDRYFKYFDFDFKKARRLADEAGIRLWSLHLPFLPFKEIDPSSPDASVRRFTKAVLCEAMEQGSDIGISLFVAHPSAEPYLPEEREERLKYSAEFYDDLAEVARGLGATIAIEDLPRSCLGNFSGEIETILAANDLLRVCLDTNHLLKEDPVDFVHRLGDKIVTMHVSDCDFLDERHWLPGEGEINWLGLYKALQEKGYGGPWLYEMRLFAVPTICRARRLTYRDLVNNAREIFAGQKPTPVGKRAEGLKPWC